MALAAFFLERFAARVVGNARAVQPVIWRQVIGDCRERRDELSQLVKLIGGELRAFLPFDHPIEFGDLAEIGIRSWIFQQPANPRSGAESVQVGCGLRTASLALYQVAPQASSFEDASPLGERIPAQNV